MEVNVQENNELSLKDLFAKIARLGRYLKSKSVLIFSFIILGGILGFAFAYWQKPLYTATTSFVLEDGGASGSSSLGNLGGLASMAGIDIGGGGGGIFQGDNILELYKSRKMIEKTLLTEVDFGGKKELLIDRYIFFNGLKSKWDKDFDVSKLNFRDIIDTSSSISIKDRRLQDSILGLIVSNIKEKYLSVSKPDKKLSIITASVKASDEKFAKAFDDNIVKNVNDFYYKTKTKKSLENVEILKQKTDSVRAVMNGAIYSAAAVSDATPNINPTRQIQRVAPVQRSQFNLETNKLVLSELVKNLELARITLRKDAPLIQVVDSPVFPLEETKTSKIKAAILGGIILGFLFVFFLIIKKMIKRLMD